MRKELPKVTCIIPAFNEEKTIGNVLETVAASPLINEIIVIDDGSTDKTANKAAEKIPLDKVIKHKKNRGKADALITGAKAAKNPILFFCDADLIGLKKAHLKELIEPVTKGEVRMVVGAQEYMNTFKESRAYQKLLESARGESALDEFTKGLGGEKVIFKTDFLSTPNIKNSRYGVEQKIVAHFKKNQIPFKYHVLEGVRHVWKFKKWGLSKGAKKEIRALLTFARQRIEAKKS
jgi:glycosyltransferase involved in cell wall biosynthesis